MVLGGDGESRNTNQEYKHFKSKILNPAIVEMRDTASLAVYIYETKGRKEVQSLYFKILNVSPEPEAQSPQETTADETALLLVGQMVELGLHQ